MTSFIKTAVSVAAVALATQAAAQITFFENDGFQGRSFTAQGTLDNFKAGGFNDRASSVVVQNNRWEVCDDAGFGGRCAVLRPGRYPSLEAMGLNDRVSSARIVGRNDRIDDNRYAPLPMTPQVTFYEHDGFGGRSFTTETQVRNFDRAGFNDRASSVVVIGDRWEVCENVRYSGRCVILRPGRYASLGAMGLNDRVSSVRAVGTNVRIDDNRYAPAPVPVYDSRRRQQEQIYAANVTSVRAVVGPPQQRCWVEQGQVAQPASGYNVPAAIAGAVLGGVLGHQVGGGRGKDLATAGGAVAGAAIGANVGGGGGGQAATADVQRCETVPSQARPEFWDVTYNFRGLEHRVQMTSPPGSTVNVNERGEPRT
jgi:uncharacterized protein YcfJ